MSDNNIVVYHNYCADGACAAWVAHKAMPHARFVPMSYSDPMPDIPDGTNLCILDFSFPRDVMLQLNERLGEDNVQLMDHHESAAHDLAGLHNCYFDMNRSGAALAWDYFCTGPNPLIVLYVQDRDLWRWQLPDSRSVNAWIGSWARDKSFRRWDRISSTVEHEPRVAVVQGESILRAQQTLVNQAASSARLMLIEGHHVPAVISPVLASEIGERLLELHPEAPFAAIHVDDGNVHRFSLRARQGGHNVATTAQTFGGGGHPATAGFTLPSQKPETLTPPH